MPLSSVCYVVTIKETSFFFKMHYLIILVKTHKQLQITNVREIC